METRSRLAVKLQRLWTSRIREKVRTRWRLKDLFGRDSEHSDLRRKHDGQENCCEWTCVQCVLRAAQIWVLPNGANGTGIRSWAPKSNRHAIHPRAQVNEDLVTLNDEELTATKKVARSVGYEFKKGSSCAEPNSLPLPERPEVTFTGGNSGESSVGSNNSLPRRAHQHLESEVPLKLLQTPSTC